MPPKTAGISATQTAAVGAAVAAASYWKLDSERWARPLGASSFQRAFQGNGSGFSAPHFEPVCFECVRNENRPYFSIGLARPRTCEMSRLRSKSGAARYCFSDFRGAHYHSRKGYNTVGSPPRAQISQFELFELILFLKLDKQFPVEQFEATASQSTVPSPPSYTPAFLIHARLPVPSACKSDHPSSGLPSARLSCIGSQEIGGTTLFQKLLKSLWIIGRL